MILVKDIFDLIRSEKLRQRQTLNLIASENFVSNDVLAASGSILTNKYAEGLPGKRYYGGCQVVDKIERVALEHVKKLFGATWANVQPHSGSAANAALMMALLKPGDKLLGFDLSHGGHLTHGSPFNFSGRLYRASYYGVKRQTGVIDWDEVADRVEQVHPRLIICGASAYSRDWDYARLRLAADRVGALLMADIAHTAGLIACGLLNDPLPYCHFVTTTTHKTLRGPRGGMILMGRDFDNPLGIKDKKGRLKPMSAVLDSSVFPGTQGGPHMHTIAAKAVAFQEALQGDFVTYSRRVQRNASVMAQAFLARGYEVVSGGTDNHLLLLDLRSKGLTGKQAEEALQKANIIVNKNMVPFDTQSPFVTSGIRLGTPAVTTRGLVEADMLQIVDWVDTVLKHVGSEGVVEKVKQAVCARMEPMPLHGKDKSTC